MEPCSKTHNPRAAGSTPAVAYVLLRHVAYEGYELGGVFFELSAALEAANFALAKLEAENDGYERWWRDTEWLSVYRVESSRFIYSMHDDAYQVLCTFEARPSGGSSE